MSTHSTSARPTARPAVALPRPWRPKIFALTVLAASMMLGACGDITAPTGSALPDTMAIAPARYANRTIDFSVLYPTLSSHNASTTKSGDTTVQSFTVDPLLGRLVKFGNSRDQVIAFPAYTLCSPTGNTYGPTEWRKPCTLAKSPIKFEVRTWNDAKGIPHADFTPDIRFNPASSTPVTLFFQAPTLRSFGTVFIPYCDRLNTCVNESVGDAALETYVAPLSGGGYWVYRMLRHFSGYTVTAD